MKTFTIIFNYAGYTYTASVRKNEKINDPTHYWLTLSDDELVKKFGVHHDYYYDGKYMKFYLGGNPDLYDFHLPIMKEIEKEFHGN